MTRYELTIDKVVYGTPTLNSPKGTMFIREITNTQNPFHNIQMNSSFPSNIAEGDEIFITFKTGYTIPANSKPIFSIEIYSNNEKVNDENRYSYAEYGSLESPFSASLKEYIASATPEHPSTVKFVVPAKSFTSTNGLVKAYQSNIVENYIFFNGRDGLYIDYKKVKAIHADGKNFKEFAIDGHIYNFRRANLPADEQTELQVLIDGYDWTHLSATGKALAANSLTWDQISGEPAIHAGVTVTGITHQAIDADGTLVATISFSRHLSDGTTDLATKQVNIAFVLIKAAPLAVWYGDDQGNVYKNGVKTYTHTGESIVSIVSNKKEDSVVYASLSGNVYKNGVKLYKMPEQSERNYNKVMLDKDNNILSVSHTSKYWKNNNEISTPYTVYNVGTNSLGNVFISDEHGNIIDSNGVTKYKHGSNGANSIQIIGNDIYTGDVDWYVYKNGVKLIEYTSGKVVQKICFDNSLNWYAFCAQGYVYKGANEIKYNLGSHIMDGSIDFKTNDIYYSTDDKKIYKNGTVLYTTEGSNPVVCVNTEYGSRTGNWD